VTMRVSFMSVPSIALDRKRTAADKKSLCMGLRQQDRAQVGDIPIAL